MVKQTAKRQKPDRINKRAVGKRRINGTRSSIEHPDGDLDPSTRRLAGQRAAANRTSGLIHRRLDRN
jgi:hypothetical protein